MKKSRIFILVLAGVLITSNLKAGDLSQLIKNQKDSLNSVLKLKISREKLFDLNKKIDIKAFPVFSIKINSSRQEILSNDLIPANGLSFFIIYYDSINYYLYNYRFDRPDMDLKLQLGKDSPYKTAINMARSKTDDVFLLFTKGMSTIGYIEKGSVKFIDPDLKTFESLTSFLQYRFGSTENYKNEVTRVSFEYEYLDKVKTLEQAKLIYKNYMHNYYRNNIYNPEALANAVIFEVDEFVKITDYQRNELRGKLIYVIERNGLGAKDIMKLPSDELYVYSIAFESIIEKTMRDNLLFEQFCEFKSNEDLFKKLDEKAENIIYEYYEKELNINDYSILRSKIIKEIFNQ